MTTRFIGVKEFRRHMARISGEARRKNQRLIVLRKNEPLFELRPLSKEDRILERLLADIGKARRDVKKKRVYTLAQVKKELGL